jgi:hypothetical protein
VNYRYGFIILALGAGLISAPALAQTTTPVSAEATAAPAPAGSFVSQAFVDPYTAKGVPLGGFRLFPTMEAVGNYDDNVFLSALDPKSDFFARETPQLMLHSDWSRHEFDIYGAGSFYQYSAFPGQDHVDWNAGADGRLDIYQGLALSGNGSYAEEHLANSSPDQPITVKSPTAFTIAQSGATLAYNPYHFGFNFGGQFNRYIYEPSKLIGGGTSDNSDRNQDLYTAFAKASYEVSPGYAVFAEANGNLNQYDERVDRSGLDRDNEGYNADLGVDMLVTNLIRGQAFAGYLDQHFKGAFRPQTGLNFGANVDWYATSLWTFHLVASRTLTGTTLSQASTEDDKQVQVSADYRLTSYITVNGSATYLDAGFDGSPRNDQYLTGRILLTYHLNPWFSVNLSDTFQTRNSTVNGQNFNDDTAMLGLKFQE